MTSWRTNLGGALGTLGTALCGIGTVGGLVSLGNGDQVSKLLIWVNVAGFLISAIGKFFAALFSADAAVLKQVAIAQDNRIDQLSADTTTLTRQVDNKKDK